MADLQHHPRHEGGDVAGAEGWAFGSQMCIGTRPSLGAETRQRQDEDDVLGEGASWPAALLNESNERLPVWKYRTRKAAVMSAVPMCVMTR